MVDVNTSAFGRIADQLEKEHKILTAPGRRYIKTLEEEKEWIKSSKILQTFKDQTNTLYVDISHKDERYVCIIGDQIKTDNLDEDVLTPAMLNAGLITLLIAEGYIKLKTSISGLDFDNQIMHQHLEEGVYNGHDYHDFLPFINSANLCLINNTSVLYASGLQRIISYVICKDQSIIALEFNNNTINMYEKIILESSDKIPFYQISQSLTSSSFKYAFLELYRLIERIFPLHYLKDLHTAVKTSLSFLDFTSSIENNISWRPKEEDAIEKVFKNSHASIISTLHTNLGSDSPDSTFRAFYKLRNSIVHFRAAHEELSFNNDQWNSILHATLEMINQHYTDNAALL